MIAGYNAKSFAAVAQPNCFMRVCGPANIEESGYKAARCHHRRREKTRRGKSRQKSVSLFFFTRLLYGESEKEIEKSSRERERKRESSAAVGFLSAREAAAHRPQRDNTRLLSGYCALSLSALGVG